MNRKDLRHAPDESLDCGDLGIADLMRAHTRRLHTRAERSGIIREILRGRTDTRGYSVFLRNLLPVYRMLEAGLARHRQTPGVGRLYQPAVFRAAALEADLDRICGAAWERSLPLLATSEQYAQRVASAAQGSGGGLIAHAYVRYLGDLNGGQVLGGILSKTLELESSALSFHRFALIPDLQAFRTQYRRAVDLAGLESGACTEILDEASAAFELSTDLSEAVQGVASSLEAGGKARGN